MGFHPSKAEDDIWMRDAGTHYECIAVYVDDLMIASHDPKGIIDALKGEPHNFKLKGVGPISSGFLSRSTICLIEVSKDGAFCTSSITIGP